MPAAAFLNAANSFSELRSLATFHELRTALQRPLRHLWERGLIDEAAADALRAAIPEAGITSLIELLASEAVQTELARYPEEIQRNILRGVVRLLLQPELLVIPGGAGREDAEAGTAEDDLPADGRKLLEWAAANGVLEALEAPAAEVLGPSTAPAEYETVASVFSPEYLLPWRREAAPDAARVRAARAYLLAQRDEVRRAVREEQAGRPITPGEAPAWKELRVALVEWRVRARPDVFPTTREVRDRGALRLVFDPARFLYLDPRPILKPRPPNRAEVIIYVGDGGRGPLAVSCDVCDQSSYCRHALAAVDRLAEWIETTRPPQ